MDYINSSHPSFIGGSRAVEMAMQQVKSSKAATTAPKHKDAVEIDKALQSERSIKSLLGRQGNGIVTEQDVCMPVMDGLQATRLIRSFEKTGNWDEARKAGVELEDSPSYDQILRGPGKRIPIIAMTANAMSESAEECFENGTRSYSTKLQVVASMDWPQVSKYKALVSAQSHRQEIIQDLYTTSTDSKRGVVPVTFIIVQKRHHTRFFPTYARGTRSVSIVLPAYYAHLAAFRARAYMEGGDLSDSDSRGGQRATRDRVADKTQSRLFMKALRV